VFVVVCGECRFCLGLIYLCLSVCVLYVYDLSEMCIIFVCVVCVTFWRVCVVSMWLCLWCVRVCLCGVSKFLNLCV